MSEETKKKIKGKPTPVEDDELIEQYIKLNEICSHSTCEKSIKLIKLKCEFCNKYFCTKHVLPEIHGCGNAARKHASAPTKKSPNAEHMELLEKKLSRKLEKKRNERKKKGK